MTARVAVLETDLEDYFCLEVAKIGGFAEKHVSPGRRGPPDRLVTFPGLPMELVEMKTIGGRLKPWQERDHAFRAKLGQRVRVLWTKRQIDEYITEKRVAISDQVRLPCGHRIDGGMCDIRCNR